MSDDLASALEAVLEAAEALLGTCGEICTAPSTRENPAEYAPVHEEWAENALKRAVKAARELGA
jgi:hypothetical protein